MPFLGFVIDGGGEGAPEYNLTIVQLTDTSVEARILDTTPVVSGEQYVIKAQRVSLNDAPIGSPVVVTANRSLLSPINVPNLVSGAIYTFRLFKKINSTETERASVKFFQLSNVVANGSIVEKNSSSKDLSASKSYMTLSNTSKTRNRFTLATRTFPSLPEESEYYNGSVLLSGEHFFSFGTSIFMDPIDTSPNQAGGVGFFLNEYGDKGYYLIIETTGSAATRDKKSVRICRAENKILKDLKTSQVTPGTTLDAIFGGRNYEIDIKVSTDTSAKKTYITVYINGFQINATDYQASTLVPYIVPTNRVGLFSEEGTTLFDYVYSRKISSTQFYNPKYDINYYAGQFSNDLLNVNFGDVIYNANSGEDDYSKQKESVDEFGKVVREIVYVNSKLNTRPAFPIRWSVGANQYTKLIASKVSNFSAEAYVLNNSSSTIPLQNNNGANFYLFGNKLGTSGQIEYTTDQSDVYSASEPITFTTKWLQSESDVKNMADWVKSKFINRGQVVTMSTFGNPLLSVGDIVTIRYPYEGLDGSSSNKFIITSLSHNYDSGLETTISCRSL